MGWAARGDSGKGSARNGIHGAIIKGCRRLVGARHASLAARGVSGTGLLMWPSGKRNGPSRDRCGVRDAEEQIRCAGQWDVRAGRGRDDAAVTGGSLVHPEHRAWGRRGRNLTSPRVPPRALATRRELLGHWADVEASRDRCRRFAKSPRPGRPTGPLMRACAEAAAAGALVADATEVGATACIAVNRNRSAERGWERREEVTSGPSRGARAVPIRHQVSNCAFKGSRALGGGAATSTDPRDASRWDQVLVMRPAPGGSPRRAMRAVDGV